MAVFSDAVGNHYMGDCIYANHNISYPNINFLQASVHDTVVADISAMLSNAGMKYRNIISQSLLNDRVAFGTDKVLMNLAPNSDTIDDRYVWTTESFFDLTFNNTPAFATGGPDLALFNDSGHTSTTTIYSNTNNLYTFAYRFPPSQESTIGQLSHKKFAFYDYLNDPDASLYSSVHWSGVCDGESVGFFITQHNFADNQRKNIFVYMGLVTDVNTNQNYYNADITTQSIFLMAYNSDVTSPNYNSTSYLRGSHYIANAGKILLYTGEALYPIQCNDGQTPTTQWATDLYILDNDAAKGYPTLGRVRNVLLGQGIYTLGKPVKIIGSVFPDAGHNHWLPVANFGSYTILLRCYSSVV